MAAPRRVASPIGPTNAVDQARDVAVDSQGNIYVAGGARTTDFPHTIGPAHAGDMDGFVAKFSPTGALLWSRLIGGPNYERLYGIEVRPGDDNEIVICGRGGPNLPTQACASCGGQLLDASFNGDIGAGPTYGPQDGWVAKLDGAGNILWLSYFGDDSGDIIRDCDIDPDGYVYVAHTGLASASPALGTTGAYRATPNGGVGPDALIAKIDPLGRAVIWATYVGGTAADGGGPSLRVHADGTVYATMHTESSDFPLVNPVDNHIGGARDFGIVRIAADGGSLLFSSYLGGSGSTEWSGTHNLAIDAAGNLYLCAETDSTDFPGTAGFFQPNNAGGTDHIFAKVKVTPPTAILAATYVGGPGTDGELQGCAVDAEGNVLAASASRGSGAAYPTTSDAIQKNPDGGSDAVVVQLAADFLSLRYATYIGGSGDDEGRAGALIPGGFVTVGATRSPDFVVANAYQVTFSDTASHDPDAYVSVFSIGAATNTVTPTPTPTDTGSPTRTRTPSRTATRSSTPTITAIPSRTATPSSTRTSSKASPSPTPSLALPTTTATAPSTATPPVTPATTEPAASPSPAQTRTAIAVVGDVNGDGHRDSGDLDALIEALFEPAPPPTGDLDGDSRITSADLLMLLRLLSA